MQQFLSFGLLETDPLLLILAFLSSFHNPKHIDRFFRRYKQIRTTGHCLIDIVVISAVISKLSHNDFLGDAILLNGGKCTIRTFFISPPIGTARTHSTDQPTLLGVLAIFKKAALSPVYHEAGTGHGHQFSGGQDRFFARVVEAELKIVDSRGFRPLLSHIRIDLIRHSKERIRLVDQVDSQVIQDIDSLAALPFPLLYALACDKPVKMALIIDHFTQPTAFDQLFNGEVVSIQPSVLVNGEQDALLLRHPAQFFGLLAGHRCRLLHNDVLSCSYSLGRHRNVILVWR